MRVLHVVEPLATGIISSISNICNSLKDVEFHVLHGAREEMPSNYKSYFNGQVVFEKWDVGRSVNPFRDKQACLDLKHYINKIKPDLIHAHASKAGALVRLTATLMKIPAIYSPRGYSFLRQDLSIPGRAIYWSIEYMLGRCPHITVACGTDEYVKAKSVANKVYYIPNVVLQEVVGNLRAHNDSDVLKVVMAGGIRPQKNFPLFLEVAKKTQDLNVQYIWVGGGQIKSNLEIPDNVTITGWKSREETLGILASANVFMQTSLWEGLPVAVLEAMVMGLPVLAKPAVGNTELVVNGYNGFLCLTSDEFVEKITWMSHNQNELERLGNCSRNIVSKCCDQELVMAKWKSLYFNYQNYYHSI